MMLWNTVSIALRETRRNKLRSALTILGIVIGVAAVIVMVTLGSGASAQVTEDIAQLGENLLTVTPGSVRRGPGGTSSSANPFTQADVDAIAREVNQVIAAAPVASKPVLAVVGNSNTSTTVTGTDNGYLQVKNWALESGRAFESSEIRAGRSVCIVGTTVRDVLFGVIDPIGESLRMGKVSCEVIGVLQSKGQTTTGADQDDVILMPLKAFQRRIAGNTDVNTIYVSAENGAVTTEAKSGIESLMRERRQLSKTTQDDFQVRDMQEVAAAMQSSTATLTALLGAVAAISLIVGGIGIMNIMLVSVTERTREIGIRLAIGARSTDVLTQFLVEAVMLSLLGGLAGVALGLGGAFVITRILAMPFVFVETIVLIAFVFSAAVGVLFGYFPARMAANLDPIAALRYE